MALADVLADAVRRAAPRLPYLRIGKALFVYGVAFCLLLAVVSERVGMAADASRSATERY